MGNKRWITGAEILKRWGALDFELLKAFDDGLYPYGTKDGRRLTRDSPCYKRRNTQTQKLVPVSDDDILIHLKVDKFNMAEVLEYERSQRIGPEPEDDKLDPLNLTPCQIRYLKAFVLNQEGRTAREIADELHPTTQDSESAEASARRDIRKGRAMLVRPDTGDS